jgi:glycerate kinase
MAEASGVRLVSSAERDPYESSTYGTGELIQRAIEGGATDIWLGAGGSATIDVGVGALAALGAKFHDSAGQQLDATPAGLKELAYIDLAEVEKRAKRTRITVLSDVDTPLRLNATVYGRQKGVQRDTEKLLQRFVLHMGTLAKARGYEILDSPWLGAGGGLAGALVAFAGARAASGAQFIASLAKLTEHVIGADILLTGEGKLDATSFHGKLPLVVALAAEERGIPTAIIAGDIVWDDIGPLPHATTCFSLASQNDDLTTALQAAPSRIAAATEQIVRLVAAVQNRREEQVKHA